MPNNPQTLQVFLASEAQWWDSEAAHWNELDYNILAGECREHAARLRTLAQAMADRVVVRADVHRHASGWCDARSGECGVEMERDQADAIAALQARLTSGGRGWPEEGDG